MSRTEEIRFVCAECGRHILSLVKARAATGLCSACVSYPAWFKRPQLRAAIDPTHDGLEVIERRQRDKEGAQ